jgi:translation elongation factor EF-Ts
MLVFVCRFAPLYTITLSTVCAGERSVRQQIVLISKQIASYNHSGRIEVMIEFACEMLKPFEETEFSTFIHEVAMHIATKNPKNISELLQQQFIQQPEITIKRLIDRAILKYKENIKVCRFI